MTRLSEAPHAEEPVHGPGPLVAVHGPQLGPAPERRVESRFKSGSGQRESGRGRTKGELTGWARWAMPSGLSSRHVSFPARPLEIAAPTIGWAAPGKTSRRPCRSSRGRGSSSASIGTPRPRFSSAQVREVGNDRSSRVNQRNRALETGLSLHGPATIPSSHDFLPLSGNPAHLIEHGLPIKVEMARGLPQGQLGHVGGVDQLVSVVEVDLTAKRRERQGTNGIWGTSDRKGRKSAEPPRADGASQEVTESCRCSGIIPAAPVRQIRSQGGEFDREGKSQVTCFQYDSMMWRMMAPLGCQKTSPPPASSCADEGRERKKGVAGDAARARASSPAGDKSHRKTTTHPQPPLPCSMGPNLDREEV